MQYDPKLKKAMDEINHILKRYDIAGVVIIHNAPLYSEYLMKVDPTYTCLKIEGDALRIKSIDLPPEEKKAAVRNSINMLTHFRDQSAMIHDMMFNVLKQLKEKVDWDDEPGDRTSHTTQNN